MLAEGGLSRAAAVHRAGGAAGRRPASRRRRSAPLRDWLLGLAADAAARAEVVRQHPGRRAAQHGRSGSRRWPGPPTSRARPPRPAASEADVPTRPRPGSRRRRPRRDGAARRGAGPLAGVRRHRRAAARAAVPGRPDPGPGHRPRSPAGRCPTRRSRTRSRRSVESLVRAAADRAAERTADAWRGRPGGAGAARRGRRTVLAGSSEDFAERLARPRSGPGRATCSTLVSDAGRRQRRTAARLASFGVNGAGLLVMLAVFAQTGGLTGAEVVIAGGTSAVSQKLLEAVFGDTAVRALAAQARHDLMERVERLLAAEADRFRRWWTRRRRRRRPRPGCVRRRPRWSWPGGPRPRSAGRPRRRTRPSEPAGRRQLACGGRRRAAPRAGRPAGGARPGRRARPRAARPAAGRRAARVAGKAGARLRLGAAHTVVALAGATGSGKSSLVNALAGGRSARSGYAGRRPRRRPRWSGAPTPPARCSTGWRSRAGTPRPTAPAYAADGLVLLDLPDFDSVQLEHRLEVDRLVELVDLLVWVLDPQKYADAALHDRYLRPLAGHADVTAGRAQPGRPARPGRAGGVPGRPAPAAGRRRAARRAGAGGVGADRRGAGRAAEGAGRPGGRPARRGAAAGGRPRTGPRRRCGRPARPAPVPGCAGRTGTRWSTRSPTRPARTRSPPRSTGRTGPGPPRSPAGRSPAGCGGCGRTRCAGCGCRRRRPRLFGPGCRGRPRCSGRGWTARCAS